jgi:NhaA family Na+:H+ antiporter
VSRPQRSLDFFVEHSLVLPLGALIALVWANLSYPSYAQVAHALEFPINDVGMVFFFALAAKEVVEATAPGGALHTWRRAALPGVAAVGGMAAPAIIFVLFVRAAGTPELSRGWAIPCATDIAFSFLVAKAIFRRHAAIPFLLLLAIADDALGLVILALFYPIGDLHLLAGRAADGVGADRRYGLRRSGAPAVLAIRRRGGSVVVGGAVSRRPASRRWRWCRSFRSCRTRRAIGSFRRGAGLAPGTALSQFEHHWKYPVQVILFLFGLANAGVPIGQNGTGTVGGVDGDSRGQADRHRGRRRAGGRRRPEASRDVDWRDIAVVGCAAGLGFTVALFFATAAFPPGAALDQSKLGALFSVASAGVAFAAAAVLRVGRFRASPAAGL